jgi:hypothetical protein
MCRSALLVFGTAAIVSCKNDLDRVAAVEVPATAPDRSTRNAEYFFSDSGVVRNRLRAGLIEEYTSARSTTQSFPKDLSSCSSMPGATGQRAYIASGRIWPDEDRMQVNEQVVFVNGKGDRWKRRS